MNNIQKNQGRKEDTEDYTNERNNGVSIVHKDIAIEVLKQIQDNQ